jgi:hypothetical protein
MIEYLTTMLIFSGFAFAYAFGLHYLGRHLRSRGYGAKLDALGRRYDELNHRKNMILFTAGARFYGGMSAFNRIPLFGSKNSAGIARQVQLQLEHERLAWQKLRK